MPRKSKATIELEKDAKAGLRAKAKLSAYEKMIKEGWRPKD